MLDNKQNTKLALQIAADYLKAANGDYKVAWVNTWSKLTAWGFAPRAIKAAEHLIALSF